MADNLDPTQVQSGDMGGAATPAAPVTPAEPVAPATPSAPQLDADRVALERRLAQYEQDVRNLKSTSDKRFNDAQTAWMQRERQLQQEIRNVRMASMDEDERKQYEANLAIEQQQTLQSELMQLRQSDQEYKANLNAIQYFLGKGVPADKLIIDQGYDALFNSGMTWMDEEMKRLRSLPATPSTAQPPAQPTLPTPPVVATTTGAPAGKPSWDDLRRKYGTDEEIYRRVELGQLPPSIIPGG